jgi:hypothetical protein
MQVALLDGIEIEYSYRAYGKSIRGERSAWYVVPDDYISKKIVEQVDEGDE